MWETPDGLPAAAGHDPLLLFADDAGQTATTRTAGSVSVRPGCRCGWDGGGGVRIPQEAPATETHPGNHDEVQAAVTAAGEGLRARWWREHLVVVAPAAELAAATPALRLDDPALADAVASAWVAGASWAEIGAAVGVARQVAWKRWHHTVHPGPPRALAPTAGGRPRRRELPAPGGWPGRPGWAHPCPELADTHSPIAYGVSLTGRERVGVTAAAAYAGPGCVCGWRGTAVEVPDVPRGQLAAALGRLADQVFAPGWNTHLHQAVPTARIWARLAAARADAADLDRLVAQARDRGASWAAIGAAVGISAQGAWDRWSIPHQTGPDGTTPRTAPTPVRRHPKRSQTTVLRAHNRR